MTQETPLPSSSTTAFFDQSRPLPAAAQQPVIAMMEDHFVVNMVVRTREKARALRRMIELSEQLLPETDAPEKAPVSVSAIERARSAVTEILTVHQNLGDTVHSHPDVDWSVIAGEIEAAERRGREQMREALNEGIRALQDIGGGNLDYGDEPLAATALHALGALDRINRALSLDPPIMQENSDG
jgi:hypothetical protein